MLALVDCCLAESVQNYEVEDFVRDCSSFNVKKSVHVQAHFDGDPVAETK